jgi:NADH dehydrogenase
MKRAVVLGGGFGGLHVAQKLKKAPVEVYLIDKTNHHLFQPLLYQVATAALSPADIAMPIRKILKDQANATVLMGEIVSVDTAAKQVVFKNGDRLGYDFLVVATGARHSYFGNDRWEACAPGLKTLTDALRIREQVLLSFEKAERMHTTETTAKYLNFVVIGGGPTGVEMAGAIAEIANKTMMKNFRRIRPESAKIYLLEAFSRILPSYPEPLSQHAQRDLEELGVCVLTGAKVTEIDASGVHIGERLIESENVIWAAGNQASPLLKTLNTPLDKQGRAIVEADLSLPGRPEVFVIGDAACAAGADGKPLPGIAPTAIQEASYVAKIIAQELPKDKRPPFRYFDKGCMATIGRSKAVAFVGKLQFSGLLAWLAWCFIHIIYLIEFRNRLAVLMQWLFQFLTSQRGVRLINRSLDEDIQKKLLR